MWTDQDEMTRLHDRPSQEYVVKYFLFQGSTSFIVEGQMFEVFCEIAQKMTFANYLDNHEYAMYVKPFGQRSIDAISCRYGKPCSIFSYALPDELIDQRDRLVEVINTAIRALTPTYARPR